MQKVSKVHAGHNLRDAIVQAVNKVGGFNHFVKTGDVVLLKPNCNTADPSPASTDLEFLKIIVELTYQAGAKLVMVGDSSTMTLNTRSVMEEKGLFDLENLKQPARVYVFEEDKWFKKDVPDGQYLKKVSLPAILEKPDKLILLPCLKTHSITQYTGALKLAVGFMKPYQRVLLHFRHIQEKIAELNLVIHPDLVIMDGRKCFINKGPAVGQVEEPDLIMASTSRVALDIEGVKVIQSYPGNSLADIKARELPQIKRAIEIGIDREV